MHVPNQMTARCQNQEHQNQDAAPHRSSGPSYALFHDLTAGSIKQGMNMHIATPIGYDPDPGVMERYPLYFVIAFLEDD